MTEHIKLVEPKEARLFSPEAGLSCQIFACNSELMLVRHLIGAPIFNDNRRAIAAVSVSGPASRITVQSVPAIAEHLLRCCREITLSLGLQAKKKSHVLSPFLRHYEN